MSTAALPFQLTKTIVCALYEMQAISKVDPLFLADTTLNYKYNVFPSELPNAAPKLAYFGMGIRGCKNIDDLNTSAPYIPSAKNLDLFTPIPFRIVPITNDLSAIERSNYRMRVMKTVDNVSYWAYYLKKLTFIDNRAKIIKTDLTTNTETTLSELDSADLNPVPANTSVEGVTETTSKISVALTASMQLTGEEVIEAINILYGGNLLKASISELGVYLGNDQTVSMSDGVGGTFSGTESIFTSLGYHYTSQGVPMNTPTAVRNIAMRLSSASAFLV